MAKSYYVKSALNKAELNNKIKLPDTRLFLPGEKFAAKTFEIRFKNWLFSNNESRNFWGWNDTSFAYICEAYLKELIGKEIIRKTPSIFDSYSYERAKEVPHLSIQSLNLQ